MTQPTSHLQAAFHHEMLPCGAEFAADLLPDRGTVAMMFRVLAGVADEPPELSGIAAIVERTLAKGTQRYTGQQLADAFDAMGAQWSTASGRQSMLVRVLCLPEFAERVIELVAELLCRPTFPQDACDVGVQLALEELKHMEDDPDSLLRVLLQKLTLGPVFGRHIGGDADGLARIRRDHISAHWSRFYHAGRLQVSIAGAVNGRKLAAQVEQAFGGWGDRTAGGREAAQFDYRPGHAHRHKDLKQQYIAITVPGMARGTPRFPVEQVLIGVLSGGMSGRLFTEVREKQGLVYWVGAWHEQLRGRGLVHLGASTTPERCHRTYETLLRELVRLGEDLTEEETDRARGSLIAHALTEDDLTRQRAAALSDDLFHFGRPIGLAAKLDAIRAVTVKDVEAYARQLPCEQICVATVGPRELEPATEQ